jgi:hypothetical protein
MNEKRRIKRIGKRNNVREHEEVIAIISQTQTLMMMASVSDKNS